MRRIDVEVAVVGSGGAGLLAALRACDRGAHVAVLEKSDRIGGTTAVSGGVLWIPCNHRMAEAGVADSRDEALTYLRRVAGGQSTEDLLAALVDHGPPMVRYLEARTPLRFAAVERPDYHPEWAGGKLSGRSLDNAPFDARSLGPDAARLRRSPHYPPITYAERYRWGRPDKFDWALVADRITRDVVTLGAALIAGLLAACRAAGIEIVLEARVDQLRCAGRRVTGLHATTAAGEDIEVAAVGGVVVASGGFEWHERMRAHFLRGPLVAPATPPWNTGDGIRLGMAIGADIGNMNEAAWFPVIRIPGEEYDGHAVARLIVEERSRPGSIVVNRQGRRFVNEATSYNEIVRAFHVFDPGTYDWVNLPAWLVFDDAYRRRYSVTTVMPGQPAPPWMAMGDTLATLAGKLGIEAANLQETITRFNGFARDGHDPDFGRGESAHDRFNGDPEHAPNPCLGPLVTPPFYGVELLPGSVSTKGGLRCDARGRVLGLDETPIGGLYACGNAMASAVGIGYPGAGGMLGPGMTFGYIAGDEAAAAGG